LKSFFENDWERAWKGSISEWQQANIDIRAIQSFFSNKTGISPEKEMDRLNKCGARILLYGASEYPPSLSQIHNPPVLLFYRGTLHADYFPSISVVGSRKISRYGQRAAELIVGQLADAGITIVSGLAFGTDTVAHRIAIEHGARTIAVLGNGIDTIYPVANQKFAEKFLAEGNGVLISEYLPGTEGKPEFFPVRNRIVSGLSRATIVIEATRQSGSLITAELAMQQNREVFAVPGEIFSKNSEGCNELLSKGSAAPALSGEQILLALDFRHLASKKSIQCAVPMTENEEQILKVFEDQSEWHIDDLLRIVSLPSSVTSSTISILEIKGFIRNSGNHIYSRIF
jgi:DNA processing protein